MSSPGTPTGEFRIEGYVDHDPVAAVYKDGRLRVHPALARRARLAAQVDEAYEGPAPSTMMMSFVSLLRAVDRLTSAEVCLVLPPQDRGGSGRPPGLLPGAEGGGRAPH